MTFGPTLCAITLMALVSPPRYGLVSPLHRGLLDGGHAAPSACPLLSFCAGSDHQPRFIGEENEAWRGQATLPRSQNGQAVQPGLELRCHYSQGAVLSTASQLQLGTTLASISYTHTHTHTLQHVQKCTWVYPNRDTHSPTDTQMKRHKQQTP